MEGNDFLDAGSTGGPAPTMTTAANPLPSMMRPNTAAAVATGGIGGLDNDNMGKCVCVGVCVSVCERTRNDDDDAVVSTIYV